MPRIAIVADDLTGANADGSLLTGKGFSAATCFDPNDWDEKSFCQIDAISVSTDSRLLSGSEAGHRVFESFRALLAHNEALVLAKRIDSTLRGNIGSEIQAALAAIDRSGRWSEPALAVVVPAFPASQRIAIGGYLVVNNVPLVHSPLASDPSNRLDTSRFVDIIARQTALPIGWIPLSFTLEGREAVRREIIRQRIGGARIVACDAVTDDDIDTIAGALRDVSFPIVAVDPGPFTAAMADARIGANARDEARNSLLVMVGSVTELTLRQMEALRLAHPCAMVRADCCALVDPERRAAAINHVITTVAARAGTAEIYGVCTAERADDVCALDELAALYGITVPLASERINSGLAAVTEALLSDPALKIGGLYTSGGEVTVAVTRRFRAHGFAVRNEVFPLAVYGRLIGGSFPDLPMVTKGGFVGDSTGIVRCIDYLATKVSSRVSLVDTSRSE